MNKDKRMKASEIPAFVDEVIGAGCDITAVGHDKYVLGDIEEQDAAIEDLDLIGEKFGDRDHLKRQIVAYLWSIGRYIDLETGETKH